MLLLISLVLLLLLLLLLILLIIIRRRRRIVIIIRILYDLLSESASNVGSLPPSGLLAPPYAVFLLRLI